MRTAKLQRVVVNGDTDFPNPLTLVAKVTGSATSLLLLNDYTKWRQELAQIYQQAAHLTKAIELIDENSLSSSAINEVEQASHQLLEMKGLLDSAISRVERTRANPSSSNLEELLTIHQAFKKVVNCTKYKYAQALIRYAELFQRMYLKS
jgi:hypothetical protein